MTKISIPKFRFSRFNDEWKENKLNEVADRVTRKNKNLDSDLPLTISAQYGLIDQETFFNKKVASKDLSNYFLVKHGEFAYNKSYSNGYPFGTIKSLKRYDKGVLSSLYIVFSIKKNISHLFMDSFFDSNHWHKEVSTKTTEGARNHGLLNISPNDFMSSRIYIPKNIVEQERIGSFFEKIDKIIELQTQKLEQLKKLKQGYLQKMFPEDGKLLPRLRFSGFGEEWKERKIVDIATIKAGGDADKTKVLSYGRYPVIANNIKNDGIIGYYNDFYNVDFPCVTVTARGTLGIPKARDYKFASVGRLLVIKSILNIHFLENLIKTMRIYNESTGVPQLTGPQFGKYNVFITQNQLEQQQIGEFFSKLDQLINNQSKKVETLKQQKKAYLQKMFI